MAQNTRTRSAAFILTLAAAFLVGVLGVMVRGAPWFWFNAVLIAYGLAWAVTAARYRRGDKWAHIACLGLAMPWAFLLCLQFCRRAFYFVAYGGEQHAGTGSPVAFLIGWSVESILLAFFIALIALLVADWRKTYL